MQSLEEKEQVGEEAGSIAGVGVVLISSFIVYMITFKRKTQVLFDL